MKISFVIVAKNVKKFIGSCLESVHETATDLAPLGVESEIIVVDNASSDQTPEAAKSACSEITLIRNTGDKGYAAAANQAIQASSGDLVFFVAPQVALEAGSARRLLDYMETNTSCGIAGGRIVDQKGFGLKGARRLPGCVSKIVSAFGIPCRCKGKATQPKEVAAVTFAFAVVRKALLCNIGKLDERFFGGYADMDLCRRAHKSLNPVWKVSFVPQASAKVVDKFAMKSEPADFSLYGESVVRARTRSEQMYFWKHFCSLTVLFFAMVDIAAHSVRFSINLLPKIGSADKRDYHCTVVRETAKAMLDTQLGSQFPTTPW
ncbi:glycosyltransferase [Desulfovibrio mangrovi]|uniref:glycosyltransferase n=1 Tax=Desulfovibrio mangrovi TaxID=2976983 RepID=UPI0022454804|nr:glycosyltransferase [Desulfovibrio mangrovi]UZP67822.1 glycosyltransferase [Desulfovibrio mangrovi]